MNIFNYGRIAGVALALLAGSTCASAASFDCAKAKRLTEVAICANPELSELDSLLGRHYQNAMDALDPAAAARLKASQLSWLRYVNLVCLAHTPAGSKLLLNESCMEREYRDRMDRLDEAGVRLGNFVLTRIDKYEAFPNEPGDSSGGHEDMTVRHVGYPRIEGGGPAVAAWNRAQAKPFVLEKPREATDVDIDFAVGCANAEMLSLEQTSYEYDHGLPHGRFSTTAVTVVLHPAIRPLQASDLFAPGSGWESKLPALFWKTYLRSDSPNIRNEDLIRETAADPSRWILTSEGLRISFSAYEGGSYITPGPITVKWSALQPMLTAKGAPSCHVSTLAKK